jgi:hypothetical protein
MLFFDVVEFPAPTVLLVAPVKVASAEAWLALALQTVRYASE